MKQMLDFAAGTPSRPGTYGIVGAVVVAGGGAVRSGMAVLRCLMGVSRDEGSPPSCDSESAHSAASKSWMQRIAAGRVGSESALVVLRRLGLFRRRGRQRLDALDGFRI